MSTSKHCRLLTSVPGRPAGRAVYAARANLKPVLVTACRWAVS